MTYIIYKISCLKNNRVYIGQTTDIKTRKRDHFGKLKRCEHHNPYLQNDYNLYGNSMFTFEIIESCGCKEEALDKETYWIDLYGGIECDKVYNCRNKFHNNSQMIKLLKNTAKNSANFGMNGKCLSNEQKEHLSKIHTGSKLSKETCEKISKANKRYTNIEIEKFRAEYKKLGTYQAVANLHNLDRNVVSRLCRFGSTNCDKIYK